MQTTIARGIPCHSEAKISLPEIDTLVRQCGFYGAYESNNSQQYYPVYTANYVREGKEVRVTYMESQSMGCGRASAILEVLDLKELKRVIRRCDWSREEVSIEKVLLFIISTTN